MTKRRHENSANAEIDRKAKIIISKKAKKKVGVWVAYMRESASEGTKNSF